MRITAIVAVLIGFFIVPTLAQTTPTSTPIRVRGTVEKLDGQNLTVKSRDVSYKGAESEFTIDPDTPVYGTATDGDTSLLKPGAAVFVIAQKQDDGKLASSRLYAEKDGIKPSM